MTESVRTRPGALSQCIDTAAPGLNLELKYVVGNPGL